MKNLKKKTAMLIVAISVLLSLVVTANAVVANFMLQRQNSEYGITTYTLWDRDTGLTYIVVDNGNSIAITPRIGIKGK